MIDCSNCKTRCHETEIFCSNCGNSLQQTGTQPTIVLPLPTHISQPVSAPFGNAVLNQNRQKNSVKKLLPVLITIALLGGLSVFGYFALRRPQAAEILPGHFGIFARNNDQLVQLPQRETKDLLAERTALKEQDNLPQVKTRPIFVVYNEGEFPATDLKLMSLDSINDDGSYKTQNLQVAPLEANASMKQIRLSDALPPGKYALARIDGKANDGKHLLWLFEIPAGENGSEAVLLETAQLELKPLPSPSSAPVKTVFIPPPPDSRPAFCNNNNVVVRSAPNLYASPIGKASRGQPLYVTQTSTNFDNWQGIVSNWAYVQVGNTNRRGWVFHHFVSYH